MTEKKGQVLEWWYKGKVVIEAEEGAVGFVYRITRYPSANHINLLRKGVGMSLPGYTKSYIGKKLLHSTRKVAIGKRAQAAEKESRADGKCKKVKKVVKDSDWLIYNSSNKTLSSEIVEHPELFDKQILHWTYSKKNTSYMEIVEMVRHSVLEIDSYNDNISGSYYRIDANKQLYDEYRERQKQKKIVK